MTYGEEIIRDLEGMHGFKLSEEMKKDIMSTPHGSQEITITLGSVEYNQVRQNDPWSGQSSETRGFKETMNTESFPPMTGDEL